MLDFFKRLGKGDKAADQPSPEDCGKNPSDRRTSSRDALTNDAIAVSAGIEVADAATNNTNPPLRHQQPQPATIIATAETSSQLPSNSSLTPSSASSSASSSATSSATPATTGIEPSPTSLSSTSISNITSFKTPKGINCPSPGEQKVFTESERVPVYPFANQVQLQREIVNQRASWQKFLEATPINLKSTWLWQYWNPENRIRNQLKKKVLSIFDPKIRLQSTIKRLLRGGVPPELRGQIWYCCSGADAKRCNSKPEEQYSALLARFSELDGTIVSADINKDLPRTFPTNEWLHGKGKDANKQLSHSEGPAKDTGLVSLRNVLYAYALRNPKVGYCQSMNYIAALLLFHMSDEDAFWVLSSLIEDILYQDYYSPSLIGCRVDNFVLSRFINKQCPVISSTLASKQATLDPVICPWFLCLFINSLPLYTVCRIWDCLLWEGNSVLFRAVLALLIMKKDTILESEDIMALYEGLRRGPGEYKVGNMSLRPDDGAMVGNASLSNANDFDDEDVSDSPFSSPGGPPPEIEHVDRSRSTDIRPSRRSGSRSQSQSDKIYEDKWYPGKFLFFHGDSRRRKSTSLDKSLIDDAFLDLSEASNLRNSASPPELVEDSAPDAPSYTSKLIHTMYDKSIVGEVSRKDIIHLRAMYLKVLEESDDKMMKLKSAQVASLIVSSDSSNKSNSNNRSESKDHGNNRAASSKTETGKSSKPLVDGNIQSGGLASDNGVGTNSNGEGRCNSDSRSKIFLDNMGSADFSRVALDYSRQTIVLNAEYEKAIETLRSSLDGKIRDLDIEHEHEEDDDASSIVADDCPPHFDGPGKLESPSTIRRETEDEGSNEINTFNETPTAKNSLPYRTAFFKRMESARAVLYRNSSLAMGTFQIQDHNALDPLRSQLAYRGQVAGFVRLRIITSDVEKKISKLPWDYQFVTIEDRYLCIYTDETLKYLQYRVRLIESDFEISHIENDDFYNSFAIYKLKEDIMRPIKLIRIEIACESFSSLEIWMMGVINATLGQFRDDENFCETTKGISRGLIGGSMPSTTSDVVMVRSIKKKVSVKLGADLINNQNKSNDMYLVRKEYFTADVMTNVHDNNTTNNLDDLVNSNGVTVVVSFNANSLVSQVFDDLDQVFCVCVSRVVCRLVNASSHNSNSNWANHAIEGIVSGSVRIGFESIGEKSDWLAGISALLLSLNSKNIKDTS